MIRINKDLFIAMSAPCLTSFTLMCLFMLAIKYLAIINLFHPNDNRFHAIEVFHKLKSIMLAVFVICFVITIHTINLIQTGIQHGVFDEDTTISEIVRRLPKTPKESELPDNPSDIFIIYFKFGCSDCEAVYPELSRQVRNQPDVYFISTRSEQGKALQEKYPIDETPTLVYIYPDGTRFAKFLLYEKDPSGQVVLAQAMLDRAFELKNTIETTERKWQTQ